MTQELVGLILEPEQLALMSKISRMINEIEDGRKRIDGRYEGRWIIGFTNIDGPFQKLKGMDFVIGERRYIERLTKKYKKYSIRRKI